MKRRTPDPLLPEVWTGWGTPPADGLPTDKSLDADFLDAVKETIHRGGEDECTGIDDTLDAERLDLAHRLTTAMGAKPADLGQVARLAYRLGVVSAERYARRIHADISGPPRTDVQIVRSAFDAWQAQYGTPLTGEERQWKHVNTALAAAGLKPITSPRSWAKWKSKHQFKP